MEHSATRALAIIESLNTRPISFVRELANDTKISKPSIVRLLNILIEKGYVERAGGGGAYTLSSRVKRLSDGYREDLAIVRVARPLMDKLTNEIKWPLALGLLEHAAMVVRHSTIPSSPLSWYLTTLYTELPLFQSAMGLALLAHMGPEQQRALMEVARQDVGSDVGRMDNAYLLEELSIVRQRGYAVRYPSRVPSIFGSGTQSISVPILSGGSPLASLSITLFARAMPPTAAAQRFAGRLTATAAAISEHLADPASVGEQTPLHP